LEIFSYIRSMEVEELASRIDQTMLKGSCVEARNFAKQSSRYPFRSLVGFPELFECFKEYWKGRLTSVANFPYGNLPLQSVEHELRMAWDKGAEEVDLVVSPYLLKDDINKYREYMRNLVGLARMIGFSVVKIIVEAPLLEEEELAKAAKIVEDVEADFLKTSTGVIAKTSHRDVYLSKVSAPSLEIKASGGIREPVQALTYFMIGASVIGTSTGLEILQKYEKIREIR